MSRSFLSALAGQFACLGALFCIHPGAFFGAPFGTPFLILLYSGPPILLVWLFLLWPLYRWVPRASVLWQPHVCVPCGLAAGVVLVALWCRVVFGEWNFQHFIYWGLGPLVGAVTSAAGCALKAAEPISAGSPHAPIVYHHATRFWQRLANWFRDHFAGWSGQ